MSVEEYLISWALYGLGALGLMLAWWRMSRSFKPLWLRNILRLSAGVALVIPYPVPLQEGFLAPAVIVTFAEGLFFTEYGFSRAGGPLLLALVLANLLYLLIDVGRDALKGPSKSPRKKTDTSPERREPTL